LVALIAPVTGEYGNRLSSGREADMNLFAFFWLAWPQDKAQWWEALREPLLVGVAVTAVVLVVVFGVRGDWQAERIRRLEEKQNEK
jgi:hypothetical protein